MTVQPMDLAPISEVELDDHWFSLLLDVWEDVLAAVKRTGVQQKKLAARIRMSPSQFNKIITGQKSNVTLRTLHSVARAAGYRLRITLEPLSSLRKANYGYEEDRRDRLLEDASTALDRRTIVQTDKSWTRKTESPGRKLIPA